MVAAPVWNTASISLRQCTRRACRDTYTISRPRRQLSTSSMRKNATVPERDYFYDIDQHGQLFLSNTKIRNFTTCFKDPAFLDFFYSRIKPVPLSSEKENEETAMLRRQGYTFLSLCGKERNYIRTQDTPIVFRALIETEASDEGALSRYGLRYAGTLRTVFQPFALRVDNRGYLYHPSPLPTTAPRRKKAATGGRGPPNPYGQYSLLASELVLSTFSQGLDIDEASGIGEYAWQGQRYAISSLEASDVTRGRGYPE